MNNSKSQIEFDLLLKKEKIQPIFRQNEEGRIYGVTFIDHDSRTVLNGSRLGKEFSANQFQELFNSPSIQNATQQEISNIQPDYRETKSGIGSTVESTIGGLFSLLPTENDIHNDNKQIPKPKKMKTRKFGRQM